MKRTFTIFVSLAALCMAFTAQAQPYTRNNVRLLSQIPLSGFSGSPASGSGGCGYISPSGKEYAIIGLRNGNAVVNITNPLLPVTVGHIPGVNSQWHEVCVLGDYAYACTEGGGGIQIIDLRQVDAGIVTLAATYTGNGVSTGHTIQAIPESKLVIINGGNPSPPGGLRALDCQNPTAPVEVGQWNTKYVHDAFYKTFTSGPYAGKTICFAFCGTGATGGMYTIDVTATTNAQGQHVPAMQTLGFIRYFPNATNFYSHSGVLSEDGKYIFANDEFDELNNLVTDASTHIIDVQDLANPTYMGKFTNPINAIDHNSMIQNGFLFLSAYKSGLRVYDVSNPLALKEAGFFDSYSNGSGKQFNGAWGTWAGFPSGNVMISDIDRGLFIVDPSEAQGFGAPITSVNATGFDVIGDPVKKLRKPDGDPLNAGVPGGSTGNITVNLATDSQAKSKLDVTVRIRSHKLMRESFKLYALNQTTGNEVMLGGWELTNEYADVKLTDLPGATYIKADNTIRLRVEIKTSKRGDAAVEVDMVKAYVHD